MLRSMPGQSAFLSTPSARRATEWVLFPLWLGLYFYPRPPRGGRLLYSGGFSPAALISIHALREEGDASPIELSAVT